MLHGGEGASTSTRPWSIPEDKLAALFSAERNMKKILYVGVGHVLLFLTAGLCRAGQTLSYTVALVTPWDATLQSGRM
jgi:hypothetical protein